MNERRSSPSVQRSRTPVHLITIIILALLLLAVLYYSNKTNPPENNPQQPQKTVPVALQIPATNASDQIIHHTGYTLSFNPSHLQASWVAYAAKGVQLESAHFPRTNKFMVDPAARPHSADDADYKNSGYDCGHLAPAEDMAWSAASMEQSFYYTNTSPQTPAFNRGVWKRLEELVHYWASAYDSIYVVTGPVLRNGLPTIGHNKVSVPEQYYKVVLRYGPKGAEGIGFVLRNEASAATLKSFAVSIDEVERLTGIDFFPQLPDDVEEKIESRLSVADWLWTKRIEGHGEYRFE